MLAGMAATAETHDAAYRALTAGAGLVDRSELGKLALTGDQAAEMLNGQVSNDVEALGPGTGCYAALLTNKGKMLGDLRVLNTGEELLLLTERSALQALFDQLRRGMIGWRAELHKRTLEQGLLSLIGPRARGVAGAGELPAEEHANTAAEIGGARVLVVATDLGVDVLCAAADTPRVRDALIEAGAVTVDEAAAELVRVESGRPRYGVDLDETTIPQEAGLNDRAVSFTKGCYVGQETVARLHWRGKPNRHLRGLRLSAPAPTGTPLRLGEREVGRLGSVGISPVHGPIALAIVRREAGIGDTLAVGAGEVTAQVVELPFG
jgi:folate-binding protein YgfZ